VNALLAGVAGKLADRWVTAVLTPGALLLAAIVIAAKLGQRHALDVARLSRWIDMVAVSPGAHSAGAIVLTAALVLAAAVAAGLVAAALGGLVRRLFLVPGNRPPASWLRAWRLHRWLRADQSARRAGADAIEAERRAVRSTEARRSGTSGTGAAGGSVIAPEADYDADAESARARARARAAAARRDAICLTQPDCPTWAADRLRAAGLRVYQAYGLDLEAAWPRLWTLASDAMRTDLADGQEKYATAMGLYGWAVLYLVVGVWWWCGAVAAVMLFVVGYALAREAVDSLAGLAESAADLLGLDLARCLGLTVEGPLTPESGERITALLRKEEH
jgi:hypothetical protein